MEKPFVLHMLTTAKNLSPFDVNMAIDAGWVAPMPYINVEASEVRGLVQDVIFSRSAKGLKNTGIFIGGRDTKEAMDMLKMAKNSMVPPFEVPVFADPSGAFTTAAGMVAAAEREINNKFNIQSLERSEYFNSWWHRPGRSNCCSPCSSGWRKSKISRPATGKNTTHRRFV